jgi:hypothetical protein
MEQAAIIAGIISAAVASAVVVAGVVRGVWLRYRPKDARPSIKEVRLLNWLLAHRAVTVNGGSEDRHFYEITSEIAIVNKGRSKATVSLESFLFIIYRKKWFRKQNTVRLSPVGQIGSVSLHLQPLGVEEANDSYKKTVALTFASKALPGYGTKGAFYPEITKSNRGNVQFELSCTDVSRNTEPRRIMRRGSLREEALQVNLLGGG